jgi:hypothetical protein
LRPGPDALSAAFMILNAIDAIAMQVLIRKAPGRDPERALVELTDMVCRYLVEDSRT